MKKFLSVGLIVIMLFSAFFFASCGNKDVSEVYAGSASFSMHTYSSRVGDVLNNTLTILPDNSASRPTYSSSNSAVAEVNALTGQITCKTIGSAIIYARVKSSISQYVGDSFTINVLEELVYANDFLLNTENKFIMGINEVVQVNNLTLIGQNVNVMPIISYSNGETCEYDYLSGEITPLNLGLTTVYVTLQTEESVITKFFEVEIVQEVVSISVQEDFTLSVNDNEFINFQVLDETTESGFALYQTVTTEVVVGSEFVNIVENDYQYLYVTSNGVSGTAIIKLTYSQDESVTRNIRIVIN